MAEFYNVNDPETVKLWSKKLWVEFRRSDAVFDPDNELVGTDYTEKPFVLIDDTQKGPGDRIRSPYAFQLTGRGVIGDTVLEGKEEAINTTTFDILIDEQIQGTRTRGKMTFQRTTFDAFEQGKMLLKDWWRRRRAVEACNHLCGYNLQTDLAYTANNAVSIPDSQHIYRINQGLGAGTDQAVGADTTAILDVEHVETLNAIAQTISPPIPPFYVNGMPFYGMLIHPYVAAAMRATNTDFYENMRRALSGGALGNNPIFSRALGEHGGVLFFLEPHITRGVNSDNINPVNTAWRNVFFGAGALQLAYGRNQPGEKEHFTWYSGTYDHGRKYHASAGLVHGIKGVRIKVDGVPRDQGKIVVTSYALNLAGIKDLDQSLPSGL